MEIGVGREGLVLGVIVDLVELQDVVVGESLDIGFFLVVVALAQNLHLQQVGDRDPLLLACLLHHFIVRAVHDQVLGGRGCFSQGQKPIRNLLMRLLGLVVIGPHAENDPSFAGVFLDAAGGPGEVFLFVEGVPGARVVLAAHVNRRKEISKSISISRSDCSSASIMASQKYIDTDTIYSLFRLRFVSVLFRFLRVLLHLVVDARRRGLHLPKDGLNELLFELLELVGIGEFFSPWVFSHCGFLGPAY